MSETVALVVELLIVPFALVLWWLFKKLMTDTSNLQKAVADNFTAGANALAEYKLHVAETFTTKNDLSEVIKAFNRSVDAIFAKLDRIEDKLDHKADKP